LTDQPPVEYKPFYEKFLFPYIFNFFFSKQKLLLISHSLEKKIKNLRPNIIHLCYLVVKNGKIQTWNVPT